MKTESHTAIKPDGEKLDVELPHIGRPACANYAFAIASLTAETNQLASIECRRHAPRPGQIASWPMVRLDDWCGMYTSRREYFDAEKIRREAAGAMRMLRDTFSQIGEDEPEKAN